MYIFAGYNYLPVTKYMYVSFTRMCNLALIAIEVVDGLNSHKVPLLWLDPHIENPWGVFKVKLFSQCSSFIYHQDIAFHVTSA